MMEFLKTQAWSLFTTYYMSTAKYIYYKYMYMTLKNSKSISDLFSKPRPYISYFISPHGYFSLNMSDTKLPPKFVLANVFNFIEQKQPCHN